MVSSSPWALLVIDMQNDFVRSDSVLCVRGAEASLPRIRRACRWFRARGWPVIWVVREHAADGSDIEAMRLELNQIPGVVENGLFLDICDVAIIGNSDGTVELRDINAGTVAQERVDLADGDNLFADIND